MASTGQSSHPRIMVFRPTMEDMKDFSKYIEYIESKGAHKAGLAKIIPPPEWKPRRRPYDDPDVSNMRIPAPIQQEVHGNGGLYHQYNVEKKRMTVAEFRKLAESPKYATPAYFDYEDLERKYWKNISFNPAIYGADVSGTIYDPDQNDFNIARLNTILDLIGEDYGVKIEGVNTAYLYFGMWKSSFAWHTEDMDLYSINYLHYGAPKSWYAIPPEHGKRLERLAAGFFPKLAKQCPAFLRHKTTIISPALLKKFSIPFDKITQEQGEFMITFPYGYHAGYNLGFNIAESTNFALPRWIEYGKRCQQCHCRKDNVHISMDRFVAKFQPERYELWKLGKDMGCHPEEPSRIYAAPLPAQLCVTDGKSKRQPAVSSLVSRRHPVEENNGSPINSDASCPLPAVEDSPQQSKKRSSSGSGSRQKKAKANGVKVMKKECQPLGGPGRQETDEEIALGVQQTVEKILFTVITSKRKMKNLPDWVLNHSPLFLSKSNVTALSKDGILLAKQNYHIQLCSTPPYCACCVPFAQPVEIVPDSLLRGLLPEVETPLMTEVLVPSTAFSEHGNREGVNMPMIEVTDQSRLLRCVRCLVKVHEACYGVSYAGSESTWVCEACLHEQWSEAFQSRRLAEPTCTLCCMRGGPLKKTVDGRWAHIICAIMLPDVCFENPIEKDVIETKHITKPRKKLICYLCKDIPMEMRSQGVCVQCNCGRAMHVTCSIGSGSPLEIGNWPVPVYVKCPIHRRKQKESAEDNDSLAVAESGEVPALVAGSNVYAKHKNGRYYPALLKSIFSITQHSVNFHDGSTTTDLNVQYMYMRDTNDPDNWIQCTEERLPNVSDEVKVLWRDGQSYKGLYCGSKQVEMFTILFEDESVINLMRKHVFGENETIPKRVLSRLSIASEQKQADFLETAAQVEGSQKSANKRKRTVNPRYDDGDSILALFT